MAEFTLDLNPAFLQKKVEDAFLAKPMRLGLILTVDAVSSTLHLTSPTSVIAVEYNEATWVRPTMTIPSVGAYNSGTGYWEMTPGQWTINPPSTISVRQIFVIEAGNTTPRNTTGTFVGFYDYGAGVTFPTGVDSFIDAPFKIKRSP